MIYSVNFAEKYLLKFKNYKDLSLEEHKKLLQIRNEKEVLKVSRNQNKIELNDHLKWIEKLPGNKKYFAVFVNEEIVGGVNYIGKNNNILDWGIFFSSSLKPFISSVATFTFIEYMFQNYDILYSEVKKDNIQALKFNQFFGVEIYDENREFYKLKLTKTKWIDHKKHLKMITKILSKNKKCEIKKTK